MKLFAIAAAAVIGASAIASNSDEARNGWVRVGNDRGENFTLYVRPLGDSGRMRRFESKFSDRNGTRMDVLDCTGRPLWPITSYSWNDIMPDSMVDGVMEIVCN